MLDRDDDGFVTQKDLFGFFTSCYILLDSLNVNVDFYYHDALSSQIEKLFEKKEKMNRVNFFYIVTISFEARFIK